MKAATSAPPYLHASPVHGAVLQVAVAVGEQVQAGQLLVLLEAMKLEVSVLAAADGQVQEVFAAPGDSVPEGAALVQLLPAAATARPPSPAAAPASDVQAAPRESLLRLQQRLALLQDAARPEAFAERRAAGRCSPRDIVSALFEPGQFTEYGALAVAAQRSRRTLDDLQRNTPADGLLTGCGPLRDGGPTVALLAYDYTVLAGTQGVFNHAKADRLLELAARHRWPVLLWAEGGGGRPGDVDWSGVAGLDCTTFARLAGLSGQVPLIGIVSGRCFAGNAALLGCCDLIIGVQGSNLGMGGPAMIEGAGLPRTPAEAIGPLEEQEAAGVIDLAVASDAEALQSALALLRHASRREPSGPPSPGGDPQSLRTVLPERRQASYEPRQIITTLFDSDSWLELRPRFGRSVITGLARLQGRPVACVASQPHHLGGALDAPSCDKLARFMQLADSWGLPLISLIDTPGFMVGAESERSGMVRHTARVFLAAAKLRVPVAVVVLRRGFGLGAMALAGGHFHAPTAICAWPDAEFGAMGIEGAVRLGFRKELQAAAPEERDALLQRRMAEAREKGHALNMASHLEIDEVIDPAETRAWLHRVLGAAGQPPPAQRRPFLDAW